MRLPNVLAAVVSALMLTASAEAQAPPAAGPPSTREIGTTGSSVPFIGDLLDHREELALSASQIENLEKLSFDLMRETIRRQAELMIAQVDFAAQLGRDTDPGKAVNLTEVETKLRELERLRTDLQMALLRAMEAAKAQLTAEQRAKLGAVLDGDDGADPDSEARSGGRGGSSSSAQGPHGAPHPSSRQAPSVGTHGTPHPGGPSHGWGSRPPHAGGQPHGPGWGSGRNWHGHGGAIVGVWPGFWWDPYWVAPPPVYVPPQIYYWYYCPSAGAYYPYVTTCPEAWVPVPAS